MIDLIPFKAGNSRVNVTTATASSDDTARAATRFLSLLLSDTDPISGIGAGFVDSLQNRGVMTSASIGSQLAISSLLAIQQMGDQSGLAPQARIRTASLVSVTYKSAVAEIVVRVTTDASPITLGFRVRTIRG